MEILRLNIYLNLVMLCLQKNVFCSGVPLINTAYFKKKKSFFVDLFFHFICNSLKGTQDLHFFVLFIQNVVFFLASLYILSPAKQPNASSESDQKTTRQIVNELYPLVDEEELQRSVERAVFGFVTYDATSVTALQQFNPVQENTECIFAKKAKLWGNQDWNQELSLGNLSH